ncbi:SMC-Scp complex subunit ScpB [Granulicella paludicola]|uniref:SMC-Scp complex subunit ScpB n=1 Tax=Granulicella paludicola TaxID=474951 RepID=UPI0021E0AD28|nr:SMC-Scp complex subunit ScpB [Granulicella paludicola]
MSLKAKIEAVIYASEEPVTLAQLIGLLGEEGQAELDVLAANQLTLGTTTGDDDSAPDQDDLNAEVFDTEEVSEPVSEETTAAEPEATDDASTAEVPSSPESAPAAEEATAEADTEPSAKTLAAEQKLAARKLRDYFRDLLDQLIAEYANSDRGFEVKEVASGFRFATKPEYHDAVRGFVKSLKPPLKLSLQALETLAVVAYKQPVTAPEVTEVRGVESAGTLGSLMTRKLVTTAGRKQVIGRPILYKTTKDFLLRFGLKDINELPSIEEFEKMAGELNEAVQEEIDMEENQPHPEAIHTDSPEETAEKEAAAEPEEKVESETPSESDHVEDSAPLDELHAVLEPTHTLHETPEDLMSDDSTHPEGHKHEPTDG